LVSDAILRGSQGSSPGGDVGHRYPYGITAVQHPYAPVGSGRLGHWVGYAGPALLAFVLGTTAWLAGLHGTDLAAQTYRSNIAHIYGIVVWDPRWYGGNAPLSYSVLAPVLGAVLGLGVLSVAAAAAAAACFDRIVVQLIGQRTLGSWYFALSTVLAVTIGQVPYLSGEAAALGAVVALLGGRKKLAVGLGLLSVLLSPLAGAFLVLVCVIWAVYDRRRRWVALAVAVACSLVVGGLGLAFPGSGAFPFGWGGLILVELLCATVLSPLVRTTRPVRLAAGLYAVASLGSFIVPNPIGGNAVRLAESFGIPVVACLVTAPARWRPKTPTGLGPLRRRWGRLHLTSFGRTVLGRTPVRRTAAGLLTLAPFVVWQWAPSTGMVVSAASPTPIPSTTATFYQPLVRQLQVRSAGLPIRVEVVPTVDHWEAAYVAPYLSLARGWDRQLDVADNPLFYEKGALTAASYRTWLLANGISWVALPKAPLDYAGMREAALLRGGRVRGLRLAWSTPAWRLWQVEGTPGLLSGAGRLTTIAPDQIDLRVSRPGAMLLRVRFSSYWRLVKGAACVAATKAGWTEVYAPDAGPVRLSISLLGGKSATCHPGT
jgi:hypothetical protein